MVSLPVSDPELENVKNGVVFYYGIKAFFIELLIIFTMYFRILPVLPCVVWGMIIVAVVLHGQL